MPLDPNIALSGRLIQLENPVNQLAQAQGVAVNALKMQEMQRGMQEQNALREWLATNPELNKAENRQKLRFGFGETGLRYGKALQEEATARLDNQTKIGAILGQHASAVLANPTLDNAINQVVRFGNATGSDISNEIADLQKIGNNPTAIANWAKGHGMKANELVSSAETARHNLATEGLTRRSQDLQYNPELQGKIEEAKVLGKARAEDVSTQTKDVSANRKALKAAGYDVATGKDEISDLIKKSTGSYLGKGADIGGAVFGKSTEGAKALAALETRANAIVYGLLNGKLGAGISNADRDFIVAQLGNLASGTTPVETRLAAWTEAKNRMKELGMVEEPTSPAVNTPKATPKPTTTPAGAMKFLGFEEPVKK